MSKQAREKLRLKIDDEAAEQWNQILEFYAQRNRSDAYSRKLDAKLDPNTGLDLHAPRARPTDRRARSEAASAGKTLCRVLPHHRRQHRSDSDYRYET